MTEEMWLVERLLFSIGHNPTATDIDILLRSMIYIQLLYIRTREYLFGTRRLC